MEHGKKGSKDIDIREQYSQHYGDDILFADGFDNAIIGICSGFDSGRVVYSIQKMLDILFKDAGMPYDEGMEYLEFNTINAYVGEKTPIYLDDVSFVEFFEGN